MNMSGKIGLIVDREKGKRSEEVLRIDPDEHTKEDG